MRVLPSISTDLFKLDDAQEIVRRTKANRLLLETVNTSSFFDGVDTAKLTAQEAREIVLAKMSKLEAVVTLPFEIAPEDSIEVPMKKGEFVIFYERTMHGSAANRTDIDRIGVNCRVVAADTLVYPQRLRGASSTARASTSAATGASRSVGARGTRRTSTASRRRGGQERVVQAGPASRARWAATWAAVAAAAALLAALVQCSTRPRRRSAPTPRAIASRRRGRASSRTT